MDSDTKPILSAIDNTMEETSGLGYDSRCGDNDGRDTGVAAAAGVGGEGARSMVFVSAVAVDADDGDGDAHEGNDDNGIAIVQHFMPPQHHLLPPRPSMPNPYCNAISEQQQNQQPQMTWLAPPPAPVMPHSLIPSQADISLPSNHPKQDIDVGNHCVNPIEKARAIAMRFQQETILQQQQQQKPSTINDTSIPNNINYAQLRHQYFQQERNKLQIFTLKNLEYIMKHEEKELRKHVAVMNEMVAYEEQQDIQLQLRQEQQKQYQLIQRQKQEQREIAGIMNEGGGGIGSMEQRRAERARRKRQQTISCTPPSDANGSSSSHHHQSNKFTSLRTSLYLTNLPTDGSITERTLQSLFCSYGRLDRVTMYRHRDTGMLKGDGLIVFGRDAVEAYQQKAGDHDGSDETNNNDSQNVIGDLVEAVCVQVRTS